MPGASGQQGHALFVGWSAPVQETLQRAFPGQQRWPGTDTGVQQFSWNIPKMLKSPKSLDNATFYC
jgi:hypothetical protein